MSVADVTKIIIKIKYNRLEESFGREKMQGTYSYSVFIILFIYLFILLVLCSTCLDLCMFKGKIRM